MNPSTVLAFSETAVNDLPFRLTKESIPFHVCNFYIITNALVYGNGAIIEAPQAVNSSFWFDNGDLKDFWFKNAAPAANCKIVAVATVPTEALKKLGVV